MPSRPRCYPAVRPVPVQNQTVHTPTATSRASKVVSIPVHFVEPEQDRSGRSTLKIQKVFRGFLVRKNVRRIAALRKEVEEIERRVSDPEAVELLRRDSKEKLWVSEMLMNVLFRLDSVRGVDSGVRDCRKAVIRRAIALQEKVDGIVAGGFEVQTADDADRAAVVEGRADGGCRAMEQVAQVDDSGAREPITGSQAVEGRADGGFKALEEVSRVDDSEAGELAPSSLEVEEQADGESKVMEEVGRTDDCGPGEPILSSQEAAGVVADDAQQLDKTEAECGGNANQMMDDSACEANHLVGCNCDLTTIVTQAGGGEAEMCIHEYVERMEDNDQVNANENAEIGAGGGPIPLTSKCLEETQSESQTDSTSNPHSLIEAHGENTYQDNGLEEEEAEEHECNGRKEGENGRGESNRRKKELLVRMVEDNQKMMEMMAELFERNERQTRMLGSLSQRVEQLERGFACEKLRKKKKRQAGCCPADYSEAYPCPKKCGKKCP